MGFVISDTDQRTYPVPILILLLNTRITMPVYNVMKSISKIPVNLKKTAGVSDRETDITAEKISTAFQSFYAFEFTDTRDQKDFFMRVTL